MYEQMTKQVPLHTSDISQWYKNEYQKLADIHCNGEKSLVRLYAQDQLAYIAEYARALYCLATSGLEDISKYGIVTSVLNDVLQNNALTKNSKIVTERSSKKSDRKQKYDIVINYCKENAGNNIKIQEVADLVDWSYPTANNFVQSRVDLFVKHSRGLYNMRNPDLERAEQKNAKKNK
jgi:hypothetical protein